jgi:hypothetical protein
VSPGTRAQSNGSGGRAPQARQALAFSLYIAVEAGAALLSRESPTAPPPAWSRACVAGDHAGPGLLKQRTGCELSSPAGRCQAQWGRLIAPDAYARWQDPDGEVDFFLHHHPAQPAADQSAFLLEGYNDLAAATGITTPVLLSAGDPDQEAQLRERLSGQRLLVPVATSNPACGPPTDPVWLPTSSPGGGQRYRLGALGHPNPWHHPICCRRHTGSPTRLKVPPGGGRTPPPQPRPARRSIPSSPNRRNQMWASD